MAGYFSLGLAVQYPVIPSKYPVEALLLGMTLSRMVAGFMAVSSGSYPAYPVFSCFMRYMYGAFYSCIKPALFVHTQPAPPLFRCALNADLNAAKSPLILPPYFPSGVSDFVSGEGGFEGGEGVVLSAMR